MAFAADGQMGGDKATGTEDEPIRAAAGIDPARTPSWVGAAPVATELDARVFQSKGQDPFFAIQEAARTVAPGQTLVLRSAFVPVPLYGVLERKGFAHHAEEVGPDEWVITFYRERAVAAETDADDTHPHGATQP